MLDFLDNFNYDLLCGIQPTDTILRLGSNAIRRLNTLSEGDHIYLTLVLQDKYEVVKYTHAGKIIGDSISVERDVGGQGTKNFPRGACVRVEWLKRTVQEYHNQIAG